MTSPSDDADNKPKPTSFEELKKQVEAETLSEQSAKDIVDRLNKAFGEVNKGAFTQASEAMKPLKDAQKSILNAMAGSVPKIDIGTGAIGDEFTKAGSQFAKALQDQEDGHRRQLEEVFEAQRQERLRQEQLEAERIEREKESLQVAKDSRQHANSAIKIAILSLIVAILALVAGIVVPLIAG